MIAARDRFYKGDIAREMVAFLQKHGAPFDLRDFAEFFARIEAPAQTTYRGYTVYKHGFGSQGPVLLQTLNILENFDLQGHGVRQRRLPAHRRRGDEAGLRRSRQLLRGSGVRAGPGRRAAVEGLREGARERDRSEAGVEVVHRGRPAAVRLARQAVALLESERAGRTTDSSQAVAPRTRGPRSARTPAACRRTRRTWPSSTRTATSST